MIPFRCSYCNRLLAKIGSNKVTAQEQLEIVGFKPAFESFKVEVKCPKCSTVNLSDSVDMGITTK